MRTDRHTKQQRRKNMQAVKSKDSKIEQKLAKALWSKGYRYRKNYSKLIGKPDIVFPSLKLAIFCDSEFWHGKNWKTAQKEIKSNRAFWYSKIEKNIARDKEVTRKLKLNGWKVLRFWGQEIEGKLETCVRKIVKQLNTDKRITKTKPVKVEKFKLPLIEPASNRHAVITHYLHNQENGLSKLLKKDAYNFTRELLQYQFPDERVTSQVAEDALQQWLFKANNVPFLPPEYPKFSFIDLFAGIGGFRIAMQRLGGKCLFTSEWDEAAKKTYKANFGEVPFGDITDEKTKHYIPNKFDVLCAGFPCQAFSIAGRRGGFEDTRGTLFFDVATIIKRKKPKAIFLENVKGLVNHDRGKTLATILKTLREDLKYYVPEPKVINAKDFGVPQNRERIFIVGFRKDLGITDFKYPRPLNKKVTFAKIKEKKTVSTKYYLSKQYLQTLRKHKARHKSKGNGFGYEIIPDNAIANAIVVGGMGKERNLVYDHRIVDYTPVTKIMGGVNREGIRKMTPPEWARLQGYPDKFRIEVSDAQAYKQFANSVAIPAIQATAHEIIELLGRINAIRK